MRFVIDSGYVKVKMFDWEAGIDKMVVVPSGKRVRINEQAELEELQMVNVLGRTLRRVSMLCQIGFLLRF